jgi:hypothetical protein
MTVTRDWPQAMVSQASFLLVQLVITLPTGHGMILYARRRSEKKTVTLGQSPDSFASLQPLTMKSFDSISMGRIM